MHCVSSNYGGAGLLLCLEIGVEPGEREIRWRRHMRLTGDKRVDGSSIGVGLAFRDPGLVITHHEVGM
jgi:hypothetical protein